MDGYDPDRGPPFVGYAVPTILGALKRHFRDSAWDIRVPRTSQQLLLALPAATGDLTQQHRRTPTPAELAAHLNVTADDVHAAINAAQFYRLPSLNIPTRSADGGQPGHDLGYEPGTIDPNYAHVDDRLSLGPLRALLAALPPREQRILTMRFYDEMTQKRIAAELNLSQMHISRLLQRSLTHLRTALCAAERDPHPPPTPPPVGGTPQAVQRPRPRSASVPEEHPVEESTGPADRADHSGTWGWNR